MRGGVLFSTLLALFVGCGGSEPEPKAPEPPHEEAPPQEAQGPKLTVASELGEIDPKATDQTFERLQPQLLICFRQGQQRVEYLSGDVKFFVRVAPDGSIRWVYLEETTMGDRDTERCMLDAIRAARWPQPKGGDAEVHKSFGFDLPSSVRAPVEWSAERVAQAIAKHGEEATKCRSGAAGDFHVTAYVEPHGKAGRVQAVGVQPPNADGDARIDCIVDAVWKMKMPSPGSFAAKVTFVL